MPAAAAASSSELVRKPPPPLLAAPADPTAGGEHAARAEAFDALRVMPAALGTRTGCSALLRGQKAAGQQLPATVRAGSRQLSAGAGGDSPGQLWQL